MDDILDPTYRYCLVRQLRAQGKSCADCQHNLKDGIRRYCRFDCRAWPKGPCARYDDADV